MPSADETVRIAMWSGPRNISTALMRSWGSRSDTIVCDEPLYAHYLMMTGLPHPGRDEIIAHYETDWRLVTEELLGPVPDGKRIYYQKHMAHHLLPHIGREWLGELKHAFLIRDPGEMLTSLIQVTPNPRLDDTGLPQQLELFEQIRNKQGKTPPVIDSKDVLDDPPGILQRLCETLDVPFQPAMLEWEAGPRETDGIWAPHWYSAVERSTRFSPYRPKQETVPARLAELLEAAQECYSSLYEHRLKAR